MLTTVAKDRPMDAFRLLDEPLWKVLWVFHHLMEREQEQALIRRAERVDAGKVSAMAFNAPKLLADEQREVREAIDALEYEPEPDPTAAGEALLARILRGRALSPEALVS